MARWLIAALFCMTTAPAAAAASLHDTPPPAAEPEAQARSNAPPPALEAIVHGLYTQLRIGGGFMVLGTKLPADSTFPQLAGASESMGLGTTVDFALGYEIIDAVAIQAVGGMTLVAGQRADRVRGLSLAYGGVGVRVAIGLSERFRLVFAPNIAYARSETQVDPTTNGAAILASAGFEYFVHVRHFSLGIDVVGLVPLAPARVFIGLAPYLRYTF